MFKYMRTRLINNNKSNLILTSNKITFFLNSYTITNLYINRTLATNSFDCALLRL